jgi:hypothetical protein
MMYLPMLAIKGNSHMLMAWIDDHIGSKRARSGTGKR